MAQNVTTDVYSTMLTSHNWPSGCQLQSINQGSEVPQFYTVIKNYECFCIDTIFIASTEFIILKCTFELSHFF